MKTLAASGLKKVLGALVVWIVLQCLNVLKHHLDELALKGFPGLEDILKKSLVLLKTSELWTAVGVTLSVVLVTTLAALLVGFSLAALFYSSRRAAELGEPVVGVLRPIPSIAVMAIGAMILGGMSDFLPYLVAFFGSVWPLTVSILEGLRSIPKSFRESALTLGKTRWQTVRDVIIPASLPSVFSALRVAVPISLLLVITTEYFNPNVGGLGSLLFDRHQQLRYYEMLTVIVMLSLISAVLEMIVDRAEWLFCDWRRHSHMRYAFE